MVAATLAIHLLLAYVLDREFDHGVRAAEEAERSHQVRAALMDVLSVHRDVETGQRGYLLTGDPEFLQPYREARGVAEGTLRTLDGRLERGSPLASGVARLRELSRAKLDFADRTVALKAAGRPARARAAVASGRGKALMDAIRAQVAAMDRLERARLADRTAEEFRAHERTRTLSFLLLAGMAAMLTAAAVAIARAWDQRRRLHTRLRDAAARQQAILDSTTDAIISLNPSGSIESLNRAARAMFGYREDELLRRDVSVLFEIAPERGRAMSFADRLGLGEAGGGRTIDITGRRSDGAAVPTEVAVSPMALPSGVHAVAVVRDATERHRVDRLKREFISTVSHELRTPLTSIAGSLGLLAGGAAGPLPPRADRLVAIAHANSERLVRLVNDILDIEKIEAGEAQFDMRPVPLADLLGRTVEANGGYAQGFGVRLELAPVDDAAHVLGDPDRLTQVFTNLLSNAVKFSPAGGVVIVMASALDGCWRVSVSDQGPGIPEAFQPRLFDKFTQADGSDTRAKGGSGLGLSIVREIVARHGGRVSFDTAEGHGTTFHVDLPRADEPARPAASAAPLPRVLHVEDDVDMTRVVASALEGRAALTPAHSLRRARELVAAERFDLVILDIGLADGSGLDLLDACGRSAPVIVFTAQEAGAELAHRARVVLVKSRASIGRLVAAVDDALGLPKEAA
ncbi:diguanylate cyclase [Sphingomonas lenta]|uniref:histidine kinase n=1 Tax=Sphingomonas lenta TaxID=1141887 RepID=A0A2A2SC73_9SPHN|nr:diguanylate cyclase [Sphingomonas lenta]